MKIKLMDRSLYLRGLLLLIRKDHRISEPEKKFMKRIGKVLGFEEEFCENAIQEVLENEHIVEAPPKFSEKELAKKFVKDGLTIAASDNEIHPTEEEWLLSIVAVNELDKEWFLQEKEISKNETYHKDHLEVDTLEVI